MASTPVSYTDLLEVNVWDYVNVELTASNYIEWRDKMVHFLKKRQLQGFIDDSLPPPPAEKIGQTENEDYLEWAKSDALVRKWIFTTLDQPNSDHVKGSATAKEMWDTIEKNSTLPCLHHKIEIARAPNFQEPDVHVDVSLTAVDTPTYIDNPRDKRRQKVNLGRYISLSSAALNGDWEKAKAFLVEEPNAAKVFITDSSETALMIAARSTDRVNFVKEILTKMDESAVILGNYIGSTALHMAAASNNIEAAKLIVVKNRASPNQPDKSNDTLLPLHIAALLGEKELVVYFLSVTDPNLYEGESGLKLMHNLVAGGLYDIALSILKAQPQLASTKPTPLESLAMKRSSFKSATRLNCYQRFIYNHVPLKLEEIEPNDNKAVPKNATTSSISVKEKLPELFWKFSESTVPQIRRMQQMKTTHHHALELLKGLCSEIDPVNQEEVDMILGGSVKIASCIGVSEVIEEILSSFPSAIYMTDENGRTIFHLAIANRQENVFNIIYQIEHKHVFMTFSDNAANNCLHLAGDLAPKEKLNLRGSAAGAALQMQRELQWFQAVKKFTLKQAEEQRNKDEQTPAMAFTKSHEELVKEGEQWMKDTSNSCTIVGALIVTIVFAAAITVPGGNNGDSGRPIFGPAMAFRIFAISDALALFTSTSSVLMFLSILTSRYGEQDFLYAIPKRLIIGLATLFLSIIFMMIAFGATLQIVFGEGRSWILIPAAVFSCVPVVLFVSLQFPLLWDMITSTYGSGIFGKSSNRILF